MISFAAKVKGEVIRQERTEEEYKATLAALLQFLSTIQINSQGLSMIIKTENSEIARMILSLLKNFYQVKTELAMIQKVKLRKNHIYVIKVLDKTKVILNDLGIWTEEGLLNHPKRSLTKKTEMAQAYLAGCFLAAGSVNDPKKPDYHLEVAGNDRALASYIVSIMKQLNMPAKMIKRRNQYVVYLKSADLINDFLAHIGAQDAAFAYADIKIRRDYYNSVTRLENCETANVVKSIVAGEKQLDDIAKLKNNNRLEKLDPKLRDVAELRLEYPEASLNELADKYYAKTGYSLSKSGMKHRLSKLSSLAQQ